MSPTGRLPCLSLPLPQRRAVLVTLTLTVVLVPENVLDPEYFTVIVWVRTEVANDRGSVTVAFPF